MSRVIDILTEMAKTAEANGEKVLAIGVDRDAYGRQIYTMKTIVDTSARTDRDKRIAKLEAEIRNIEAEE